MNHQIDNDVIYVSLLPDESVMDSLIAISKKLNLKSGWISGIGAIEGALIGMYDIRKKKYDKKQFTEEYELISFNGNITIKNDEPFVHAHIVFSDSEYKAFGGHLFETKISVAGEFIIHKSNKIIKRRMYQPVGLPLWCLSDE